MKSLSDVYGRFFLMFQIISWYTPHYVNMNAKVYLFFYLKLSQIQYQHRFQWWHV